MKNINYRLAAVFAFLGMVLFFIVRDYYVEKYNLSTVVGILGGVSIAISLGLIIRGFINQGKVDENDR